MRLQYQKLSETAKDPIQGYAGDLGIDLRTPEDFIIQSGSNTTVDTQIQIRIPEVPESLRDCFQLGCFIHSKSGLAVKSNIEKGAGVVDPNYTGSLKIKLYNHGNQPVNFQSGDKIAQMVFMLCAKIEGLDETDLSDHQTNRGDAGFGSSGR